MDAYICLPETVDIGTCSHSNFFKEYQPTLHLTVDEAIKDFTFKPESHYIIHIEFIDKKEVLKAVMAAYYGNTNTQFSIAILETIIVTKK